MKDSFRKYEAHKNKNIFEKLIKQEKIEEFVRKVVFTYKWFYFLSQAVER